MLISTILRKVLINAYKEQGSTVIKFTYGFCYVIKNYPYYQVILVGESVEFHIHAYNDWDFAFKFKEQYVTRIENYFEGRKRGKR